LPAATKFDVKEMTHLAADAIRAGALRWKARARFERYNWGPAGQSSAAASRVRRDSSPRSLPQSMSGRCPKTLRFWARPLENPVRGYPLAMAAIVFHTLRDYARTYMVYARCPECCHDVRLDLMAIAQRVGWDVPLSAIHRALRCSQCGNGGAQISIVHDGRPA